MQGVEQQVQEDLLDLMRIAVHGWKLRVAALDHHGEAQHRHSDRVVEDLVQIDPLEATASGVGEGSHVAHDRRHPVDALHGLLDQLLALGDQRLERQGVRRLVRGVREGLPVVAELHQVRAHARDGARDLVSDTRRQLAHRGEAP